MNDPIRQPGAFTAWGYVHSQGTNWFSTENEARASMERSMSSDHRTQRAYQKRHRLVKRELGPIVEVENPWAVSERESSENRDA